MTADGPVLESGSVKGKSGKSRWSEKHNMRIRQVSVVTFGSIMVLFAALAQAAAPDEPAIREAVLARFDRLHNLIVHYTTTSHLRLPPGMRLEDTLVKTERGYRFTEVGTKVEKEEFSLLSNLLFCRQVEQSFTSDIKDPAFLQVRRLDRRTGILTPGSKTVLLGLTRAGRTDYEGQIHDTGAVPSSYILTALGLGVRELSRPFTADDFRHMKIERSGDGKIVLARAEDPNVDEWTLDPARGYAITRYQRRSTANAGGSDWTMDDFKEVGGVLLPHKIRVFLRGENGSKGSDFVVDVSEYKINDPAHTAERYRMQWPEGTPVTDFRAGAVFVAREGELVYDSARTAQFLKESPDANEPPEW